MIEKRLEKKFVLGKFKDDLVKFLSVNGFLNNFQTG